MPKNYDISSPQEIEAYGKRLINRALGSLPGEVAIPEEKLLLPIGGRNRAGFGTLLERYYYGINPPNTSKPDFPEAGVELKSNPVKKSKSGYVAKEKLVLNIINYIEEAKKGFRDSSLFIRIQ